MGASASLGGPLGMVGAVGRRESESSDSLLLSPEASKATEAVEFIAEHLRNEDQYIQVRRMFSVKGTTRGKAKGG